MDEQKLEHNDSNENKSLIRMLLSSPLDESTHESQTSNNQKEYSVKIIINDMNGNNQLFAFNLEEDITQSASKLINFTAYDILVDFCSRNGIEKEGLLIFTSKWMILHNDSKIWPLFLRKKKKSKNQQEGQNKKRQKKKKTLKNKDLIEDHFLLEIESPTKILQKMIRIFTKETCPIIKLYIRKNKEKTQNYDIIVTNIPYEMEEEQLRAHFDRFGQVSKIVIFKNIDGKSKGIARITFDNQKYAQEAIKNGKTLNFKNGKYNCMFNVFRPISQYSSVSNYELN